LEFEILSSFPGNSAFIPKNAKTAGQSLRFLQQTKKRGEENEKENYHLVPSSYQPDVKKKRGKILRLY
jgi:hypothetical protein